MPRLPASPARFPRRRSIYPHPYIQRTVTVPIHDETRCCLGIVDSGLQREHETSAYQLSNCKFPHGPEFCCHARQPSLSSPSLGQSIYGHIVSGGACVVATTSHPRQQWGNSAHPVLHPGRYPVQRLIMHAGSPIACGYAAYYRYCPIQDPAWHSTPLPRLESSLAFWLSSHVACNPSIAQACLASFTKVNRARNSLHSCCSVCSGRQASSLIRYHRTQGIPTSQVDPLLLLMSTSRRPLDGKSDTQIVGSYACMHYTRSIKRWHAAPSRASMSSPQSQLST